MTINSQNRSIQGLLCQRHSRYNYRLLDLEEALQNITGPFLVVLNKTSFSNCNQQRIGAQKVTGGSGPLARIRRKS